MLNNERKSARTTPEKQENTILTLEGKLPCTSLLEEYLDARSLVAFSQTCRATQRISFYALLKSLLKAVVLGDEKLAKKIVTAHPELLLEASACVKDLSGKEIKGLTPLQAAICAGDVDMAQMMIEVLQHKLQVGIHLSFEPVLEIQHQFSVIYHDGIDAVVAAQKVQAQEFKTSVLSKIFAAINATQQDEQIQYELNTPGQTIIATEEEIRFELENPGEISARRQLNAALHNFRKQFATISNQEQIFNPFYLLAAFELYDEQFDNFNGNPDSESQLNRRRLFWRQVIGYIQRYLPACNLQAFAQGICYIVENREKLKRDFEFRFDKDFYMRVVDGDLNNLGYKYGAGVGGARLFAVRHAADSRRLIFKIYCEQKNQVWRTYAQSRRQRLPLLHAEQVRNSVKSSCCNIS